MNPYDPHYYMTDEMQWTTLIIAAGAVFMVCLGIYAIVTNILREEQEQADLESIQGIEAELDELADDLFMNRDQHLRVHVEGWRD